MSTSKERPILFSGPMVRAILEGRKTHTRRVVKPQPASGCHYVINEVQSAACHLHTDSFKAGNYSQCYVPPTPKSDSHLLPCPYGQPGDRLWVRETFQENEPPSGWLYRADDIAGHINSPWKPSIFMPRAACRIMLKIVSVRVERLQEICEEDAIAEGIRELPLQENEPGAWWCADPLGNTALRCRTPRSAFARLWESINGETSWIANPYVWVVEFKRIR